MSDHRDASAPDVELDIRELTEMFPSFRVALMQANGVSVVVGGKSDLDDAVLAAETSTRAEIGNRELGELPEIACWRHAYRTFGVKSTSYRSSVERLVKTIVRGKGLPRISNVVDAYNAISATYRMPIGADDLDKVTSPLAFRFRRDADTFIALGDAEQKLDPPTPGEVVYADTTKVLCRRWNWYQDARSAVSTITKRAVLTVQALDERNGERLGEAASRLAELLARVCGSDQTWVIADRHQPVVGLPS